MSIQDTPSRKLDQYIVRFPDGVRDELKRAAEANNRSLNAEIVSRLQQPDPIAERLERIERKLDQILTSQGMVTDDA